MIEIGKNGPSEKKIMKSKLPKVDKWKLAVFIPKGPMYNRKK